jgi:hypothetical protein
LLDGQEKAPCPDPLLPDTDRDGIVDGRDLNPCDSGNPSITQTAAAGIPNPPATDTPISPPRPHLQKLPAVLGFLAFNPTVTEFLISIR